MDNDIYLKLKKEANELSKIPGSSRGEIIKDHFSYIRFKRGEEGVKKVREMMEKLGYPIKLEEVGSLEWYPEFLTVLIILVAKEIFHWGDEEIFEWGYQTPKFSFIVRLLAKSFINLKMAYQKSPIYWKKHYDFGELETPEFNEREKYLIIRIKGYKFHPIVCTFYKGYFIKIAEFTSKGKKFKAEETKCMFRGDPYHEFKISWQEIE